MSGRRVRPFQRMARRPKGLKAVTCFGRPSHRVHGHRHTWRPADRPRRREPAYGVRARVLAETTSTGQAQSSAQGRAQRRWLSSKIRSAQPASCAASRATSTAVHMRARGHEARNGVREVSRAWFRASGMVLGIVGGVVKFPRDLPRAPRTRLRAAAAEQIVAIARGCQARQIRMRRKGGLARTSKRRGWWSRSGFLVHCRR